MARRYKMMTAVVPEMRVIPTGLEIDRYDIGRGDFARPDWVWSCDPEDSFEYDSDKLAWFISKALRDPRFKFYVEVAAAHIVAAKALSDKWYRVDRFKTRIDEWVMPVWDLAQEIYELNSHMVAPYEGARRRSRSAVGLERLRRKWASAKFERAVE